jgi:hypothetical protein
METRESVRLLWSSLNSHIERNFNCIELCCDDFDVLCAETRRLYRKIPVRWIIFVASVEIFEVPTRSTLTC